jgi:hypothetical protein
MRFFVIGHSLYEKMLSPYIGMTAHGIIFNIENNLSLTTSKTSTTDDNFFNYPLDQQLNKVDEFAARSLSEMNDKEKIEKFFPLPVLGIPGSDKRNEEEMFYDNKDYFRANKEATFTKRIFWISPDTLASHT